MDKQIKVILKIMGKHAYLILAHTDMVQLQRLISCLDDRRNDIYVHIDKKAVFEDKEIYTHYASLTILENRLDARWGNFSLVEVELLLFEKALKNGPYLYYHLLSGADLPIKSQDYIHDYCEQHQGKEFIGFALHTPEKELKWRMHYFLFARDFKSQCLWKRMVRYIFVNIQDRLGWKRQVGNWEIKKGAQWCSVTNDFVTHLLAYKQIIHRLFYHTYCPDELFIQTVCWNSDFRNRIFDLTDEFAGCKRYIKWKEGELRVLDLEDVELMEQSDRWFARKFSSIGHGKQIADAVLSGLNNGKLRDGN